MLLEKAITHVRKPTTLGYYSRLFLVPKPMKRWRPVIDLSMLNNHLHVPTFKMETAESIRKSIRKGEWVTSIDLTGTYFHVPIHPQSQKYLRFETKRGFYNFGHSLLVSHSPRVYSHCERGNTHSSSQEPQNPSISGRLASSVTNKGTMSQIFRKFSEIGPRTSLAYQFSKVGIGSHTKTRFSGLSLRSSEGSDLSNPKETRSVKSSDCFHQKVISLDSKKAHVTHWDISFLRKNSTTGKVTHETFPVVPKVTLEISPVTGQKDPSNREFSESSQMVGESTESYGRWSYTSSYSQHTGIHRCLPKRLGAHLNEIVLSGLWSNKEAQLHINVLELKAVLIALKGFQEHLQGQRVLICSDNSTVVSYLNKEGGTHSIEMCALIWRILAFTNSRRIQIRARHVHGSLNVIADSLSQRDKVIQTEWSLHQQIFNQICRVWHTPMVDLFATHLNYKLPIYVSPVPDKKAWQIDALNICWEGLDGYVFYPVAILPQVIKKIITYPYRMIVLAPGWPGMPWFWDLVDLLTRVPLQLPHWKTLPKQPHSNRFHNNVEYLNLHVWLLDSRNPILEDSHLRWQKELRHLRGNPQEKSINQGGPFMGNGAHRIRWTSPQQLFPR